MPRFYFFSTVVLFLGLQGHMIMAESPNLSSLPRHSSSKALTLARSAEVELNRPNSQGLLTAITILEELTDDPSFRRLQNDERITVYNMLIDAYLRADMGKEAENLSTHLLKDEAFKPYWIALRVRLGNSLLAQENLSALAKNIKELLRYPKRRLSSDDAAAITTLWAKIERHGETKRKAAERLWGLKEYAKAAKIYQYLFDSSNEHTLNNTFSKENHTALVCDLSYRLAACYFLIGNFEKCLEVLKTSDPKTDAGYILRGLTEKNLGQYTASLTSFQKVANPSDKVLWETCFAACKAGLTLEARKLLSTLPDLPASTVLEVLVEIQDDRYEQASNLIAQLNKDSSYHFLKGYLLLHQGAKEAACIELEQAILIRSPYQADALIHLGKTYLALASSNNGQARFLERAHACFETLSNKSGIDKVEGILGLAKVYSHQKSIDKLEKLRAAIDPHTLTREQDFELTLHILECTQNYDWLFLPENQSLAAIQPLYTKALIQSQKKEHIDKAFTWLQESNTIDANYPLFEKIIIFYLDKNLPETACAYVEKALLIQKNPDLIERSHWLYILSSCEVCKVAKNKKLSYEKALWLCNQFLQKYPDSSYFAEVLFQKALLCWQANEYSDALTAFSLLEADYPHAEHRDAVLFFMGSILDMQNKPSKTYFTELCQDFPQSPYAPESYWRQYSEQQYTSGDIQAIGHLKKMPASYAESPFAILAAIIIAQQNKEECPKNSLSIAQTKSLQEVISLLDSAINQGYKLAPTLSLGMQANFIERLHEAEYEKAATYFILANFTEVLDGCIKLKEKISNRPHPQLKLWQKTSYLLSRAHLLQGNESLAREELANLVEFSTMSGYTKGEPLILALLDLAQSRTKDAEYDEAFKLLETALTVASAEENQDLTLEILIAKAQAHRKCKELDKAMMLLSSVINEHSASASRIHAMFLRAELYEEKGRRDLAFRQLQTCAKKGGEWSVRAAKKLEDNYGFE